MTNALTRYSKVYPELAELAIIRTVQFQTNPQTVSFDRFKTVPQATLDACVQVG